MKERFGIVAILLTLAVVPCSAGTKGDIKNGQAVFQNQNCAICHTDGGNNVNPEKPLKGAPFLKRYPAADNKNLELVIRTGIKDKGMPSFGKDKMSDKELTDVIAYIRSLTPETKGK